MKTAICSGICVRPYIIMVVIYFYLEMEDSRILKFYIKVLYLLSFLLPINVLKSSDFCLSNLTECINEGFAGKKFSDTLKLRDITPIYKKLTQVIKPINRLVSILPLISKIFEKFMYDKISG